MEKEIKIDEGQVVHFLMQNPCFFEKHLDILEKIKLFNPYGKRVLSLSEKQMQILRAKNKTLEQNFSQLIRVAQKNSEIMSKIMHWATLLISEKSPSFSPEKLCVYLRDIFDLAQIKLFIERLDISFHTSPDIELVSKPIKLMMQALKKPYSGTYAELSAMNNLNPFSSLNIDPNQNQSLAILPLFPTIISTSSYLSSLPAKPSQPAFGLLVLGDQNLNRFQTDQGVYFLEYIAVLASAALSHFA